MAKAPVKAPAEKTVFIPVTKDGEVLHVHPTQVEQHQRLGWKKVEKEK